MTIIINTRTLKHNLTGTQRYLKEILNRIGDNANYVEPPNRFAQGIKGHLWEQIILPTKIKNNILWSPGNTGPIATKRQVISIMDFTTIDHPEWFSKSFSSLYQFILPRLVKNTLHTIAISEYTKERIIKLTGVGEDKVTVTLLAADKRFIPSTIDKIQYLKDSLGISKNYILSVGSLEPRKNLKRLFDAWKNWQNRPDDLELVVAGGQGKVFSNIGFDEVPNGIKLLGRVDDTDLPVLYSGAIFFIYPSLYEGFGLPPLEAMSCGTPVISSNTTSIPEVVGDAGLLINPCSTGEILDAMKEMYKNESLRIRYNKEGIERAKLFSWENTAKETVNILKSFE